MYKELTIKNIKIFKDEQTLKIAPITLLYGENSSGKTTLLKSFDIIHNIFSEREVKRGKNVSQKDSPFYRNENIQNISPKKIHYYSNQLNKKPQEISMVVDTVIDDENLKHYFKDYLSNSPIASDLNKKIHRFAAPIKVKLTIKYFPKKKISKVDNIKFQTDNGKNLISFSRINKIYPKISEIFDKDKVGYISPSFNKILSRPNRFNPMFHRGRPIAEEDYFVDESLYADYKFRIEDNAIWEKEYSSYEKIFDKGELINERLQKIQILFKVLNQFRYKEFFKNPSLSFDNFSHFLSLELLKSKEKNINKFSKKFDQYLKKATGKSAKDKVWRKKIETLRVKNEKKFIFYNTFFDSKKSKMKRTSQNPKERQFTLEQFFATLISKSWHTNLILIKNLLNRKFTKTSFVTHGKRDSELFNMRFFKRSSYLNASLVRNDYESPTSYDILRNLALFINGGLENLFIKKSNYFVDFVEYKTHNTTDLLPKLMTRIRHLVNNFVICHPSKTNVDWHVANERDLPENMRKALETMEQEDKKKDILRGDASSQIGEAALIAARAIFKKSSNKELSKQDEKTRIEHLKKSKESIRPENIAADGRNFHSALINDTKFRAKLNKSLKQLLDLELMIVTPKFLKKLLQDPERYKRFRIAQRSGMMYPTGMSRYSRTKFIMLRDLKFKKSFHIHGEEVGKGPTNILPFLAQIMSESPSLTYIIQELENNWHPKYQSKIIEFIATRMKEFQSKDNPDRNKYFVLETHSELFVLQIKKLVEKGFLRPEDVSINFVERTKDGNSKVFHLPLNSEGAFTQKWPGGFFTERTDILTS